MYLIYADESGNTGTDLDNKQQPIFILGGPLIKDTDWHKINYTFNKEKVNICPYFEKNEIHTGEIFNSSKHSYFDERDWQENLKTLEQLVDLIIQLDIKFQYVLIDKKSFKQMNMDKFGALIKVDPYMYAFSQLSINLSEYLSSINETGIILLDEIIKIDQQISALYPNLDLSFNTSIIENPFFIKSNYTNFIQIADIFAFYMNKYHSIKKGYKKYSDIKEQHCIDIFNKFSKNIRIHISL